ncbi:MAG: septum formation initiator family protein [Oscillospiraceae bacterium]|nr:septum formation initiator family protein [Oscillospiraceae bacterium]
MASIMKFLSRIKLVYRRSSNLTKVVVTAAIVLSMAALITLRLSINDIRNQTAALESQASQLAQENDELQEDIAALGSIQSVEEIAREELGLVDPDTVLISPAS